jgi:hypothetical protein
MQGMGPHDVPEFGQKMKVHCKQLSNTARTELLPFPSTYLCEASFSAMTGLKTKLRNRMSPENETHPHLVPRLRMSRSYTSSPPKRLHGV